MKIKILIVAIILSVFWGCGDLTDEIVNTPNSEYNVSEISAPDYVVFSQSDSSIVASIKIDNSGIISQAWFNVLTADGSESIITNVAMKDDGNEIRNGDETAGDNVYSGKSYLGRNNPSSKYLLQFYVKDKINNEDDNTRLVGIHEFEYSNGDNNSAPVITDLVMPDSIKRGVDFVFTVKVSDDNGLKDISQVYFRFTRPDNSSSGSILMADDGDPKFGDEIAGDGIYSFKNSFSDGSQNDPAQPGEWSFIFRAQDKSGLISNQISHTIIVLE